MVATEAEVAAPSAVGPSPIGGPLRVGMFGGGTVGGGVYEICEQVKTMHTCGAGLKMVAYHAICVYHLT